MSARLGVLVSLGLVVVGEAVGTEVVTAATPTPSACTHSHNSDESLLTNSDIGRFYTLVVSYRLSTGTELGDFE